jgi:hypothetical protein
MATTSRERRPGTRSRGRGAAAAFGFILLFVFGLTPLYYQIELNKVVERYGVPEGAPVALATAV